MIDKATGNDIVDTRERSEDIKNYLVNQKRFDNIETLKDFKTLISLLKTNYLETSIQLHEGKNLHEMVKDLKNELTSEIKEEQFVPAWLKLKMGILFETKEMNPPYFFSWEFTAGTYAPILFPFIVTLL